jgi:hypothetical protein
MPKRKMSAKALDELALEALKKGKVAGAKAILALKGTHHRTKKKAPARKTTRRKKRSTRRR